MSFSNLDLKITYRTNDGAIVNNFYLPCLKRATEYKRAVGYFTSDGLAIAAKGLTAFINKENAHMKLIASPHLEKDDIEAIKKGYKSRDKLVEVALLKELEDIPNKIVQDRLSFLAWLIAEKKLEIKLAYMTNPNSGFGIYHEKLGLFLDDEQNIIAFSGSSNETKGGLYNNFEAIDVFCSWKEGDRQRALSKNEYFDELWQDKIKGLRVIPFPEAARDKLLKYKTRDKPTTEYLQPPEKKYDSESVLKKAAIPDYIDLRRYQKDAIVSWFENDGQGVMKMATGTGKTITALAASVKMHQFYQSQDSPLCVIVICPYQHLVTQWNNEARNFGYSPIKCFKSVHQWIHAANSKINSLNAGAIDQLMFITTTKTFGMESFQNTIKNIRTPILLIADEVHNLGSKSLQKCLPRQIKNRIGLSATPERWFDEEGTKALYNYFGKPVIKFGLEEAIEDNYLTQYDYHPVVVPLTDYELEEYLELSTKIARCFQQNSDLDTNEPLKMLLIRRARLTASAENKINILKSILQKINITDTTHNLIYCGDGTVDTGTTEDEQRQIDAVKMMLGRELGLHVASYTAETPNNRRTEILKEFEKGELQGLVAIQCLDEGVDVPATRRAFILASSSNPRQFIQRRGRVLRRHPGKNKAEIWDFLVIPPCNSLREETFNVERNMIKKELTRVIEFTQLARNGPQAEKKLLQLKKDYNLLDL